MRLSNMMTMISFLPFISNVALSAKWYVAYTPTHICALEGSSVNMSCSYTSPIKLKVIDAFWINQDSKQPFDFSKNESYKHRVQVKCDKINSCSLHMTKLTKSDTEYQYYCRIKTKDDIKNWIGKPGISVNITGLEIVSPIKGSVVKEGDHVTLTCKTTCKLTGSPSFIWSKDGRPVEKKQIINNQLQLHPVSYEDEGSYTCAVRGYDDLTSASMRIKVICPTVVSSDREDAKVGDHVTLTCNTTCNLPGTYSFIWSKNGRPVEKKQIINNQLLLHPVSYEDEGNYTCAVRGHEGHHTKSARLQLTITASESPWIGALVIMAGLLSLLCVVFWTRSYKINHFGTQERDEGQDDVQHSTATVDLQEPRDSHSARGAVNDDLYSTINPRCSREMGHTERAQEDDLQYVSLQFRQRSCDLKSSSNQPQEETSVIYSSIQMSVKKSMTLQESGPQFECSSEK